MGGDERTGRGRGSLATITRALGWLHLCESTVRTAPYSVILLDRLDIPLLDARHVEQLETLRTHPHGLCAVNGVETHKAVVGLVVDLCDQRGEVLIVFGFLHRNGGFHNKVFVQPLRSRDGSHKIHLLRHRLA